METDLRFPVGKFQRPAASLTDVQRSQHIEAIAAAPVRMNEAVEGLKPEQLDTRYRPEGWTVRQVVHHVPDSHMNSYVRFKLALTEDLPLIKPYDEAKWAELGDVRTAPIEPSLALLENLHQRWVLLLRTRCMRGTGNITSRTSHRCANAKDGGSAAENRKAKLENGTAWKTPIIARRGRPY